MITNNEIQLNLCLEANSTIPEIRNCQKTGHEKQKSEVLTERRATMREKAREQARKVESPKLVRRNLREYKRKRDGCVCHNQVKKYL